MKIYIVAIAYHYESTSIEKVFSTKEKAIEWVKQRMGADFEKTKPIQYGLYLDFTPRHASHSFEIHEMEVDEC